jgi:hypothetical protein
VNELRSIGMAIVHFTDPIEPMDIVQHARLSQKAA